MQVRVEKCPGGITLRVPERLATLAGLAEGSTADVEVSGDRLVVRSTPVLSLDELVAKITPENRHDEWKTGGPVGEELL